MPRIIVLKDPLTPEEHINLGVSYERQGELEQAIVQYETAAKKLPIAYLYIGNVHFSRGDYEKAESAYKKAVRETNDPGAMNNLAWLYYTMGKNLDKAEGLALKAVELSPQSVEFKDTLEKIREKLAGG